METMSIVRVVDQEVNSISDAQSTVERPVKELFEEVILRSAFGGLKFELVYLYIDHYVNRLWGPFCENWKKTKLVAERSYWSAVTF